MVRLVKTLSQLNLTNPVLLSHNHEACFHLIIHYFNFKTDHEASMVTSARTGYQRLGQEHICIIVTGLVLRTSSATYHTIII